MPTDHIRYDLLVQEALRSVVRKVLGDAARNGLPGDHHFYISFKTHAPGVTVPAAMRQKYPDEMTIILQHEFWDLSVNGEGFEVSLSFSRKPERLAIPFAAITGFSDPSVPTFGFKFIVPDAAEAADATPAAHSDATPKAKNEAEPAPKRTQPSGATPKPLGSAKPAEPPSAAKATDKSETTKVVSIDAFARNSPMADDRMGEIVNLRRARKRQAIAQAEFSAAANRVASSVSKKARALAESRRALAQKHLDGHRIARSDDSV